MKATTTFKSIEMADMTVDRMKQELRESREAGGWLKGMPETDIENWINGDVQELLRLAATFPEGATLEKRGNSIRMRTVVVPKPRKSRRKPVPLQKQPDEQSLRFA